MPDDKKRAFDRHTIVMEQRESVSITGVMDVISFDEETIIAETELGVLVIKGSNLHVNKLNLDNGELDIEGEMNALNYEDRGSISKNKNSFLGKLFR